MTVSGAVTKQLTSSEMLTNATRQQQQKDILGEHLYPLITQICTHLCRKITDMLLDIEKEILHLLESPKVLYERV